MTAFKHSLIIKFGVNILHIKSVHIGQEMSEDIRALVADVMCIMEDIKQDGGIEKEVCSKTSNTFYAVSSILGIVTLKYNYKLIIVTTGSHSKVPK